MRRLAGRVAGRVTLRAPLLAVGVSATQLRSAVVRLAVVRPDVAAEWHPARNVLPLDEVDAAAPDTAWWRCNECDHEWQDAVAARVSESKPCPMCIKRRAQPGTGGMSLEEMYPHLCRRWDAAGNGNLTPADVSCTSNRLVWWSSERNPEHTFQATVQEFIADPTCPAERHCDVLAARSDALEWARSALNMDDALPVVASEAAATAEHVLLTLWGRKMENRGASRVNNAVFDACNEERESSAVVARRKAREQSRELRVIEERFQQKGCPPLCRATGVTQAERPVAVRKPISDKTPAPTLAPGAKIVLKQRAEEASPAAPSPDADGSSVMSTGSSRRRRKVVRVGDAQGK